MSERRMWVAIAEDVVVGWWESGEGPGITRGPDGLVMYGPIDSTRLRDVPVSRLVARKPGHPVWEQDAPPSADDVVRRWRASAGARARLTRTADDRSGSGTISGTGSLAATGQSGDVLAPRLEGESADAFYVRVAAFYRATAERTGKPLAAIQASAGVPKTTAARWVREARARGHLDPTTRGRGRG